MTSYLKKPTLFNTGYLPYNAIQRMKQDLSPQELSNDCQYMENTCKTNVCSAGGTCSNFTMYPFYAVPLIYDQDIPIYNPKYSRESCCSTNVDIVKTPPLTTGSNVYPVNVPSFDTNPVHLERTKYMKKNLSTGAVPTNCNCAKYVLPP